LELQQAAADRVTTSGYDSLLEAEASLLFGASAVMFDNQANATSTRNSAAGPRTAASTRTTAKGRAGTHVNLLHIRTLHCLQYCNFDCLYVLLLVLVCESGCL
jgi:hypothetical protein